jgi:syndecan 4
VTDYTFANGGTEACNDYNSLPNAFICPTQWQNVRINGQIWVDTAADDDTIGFVWGYQDAAHFYLLSWRELDQSTFSEGILVKRIHAEGGAATITVADLEQPVDTINSTVLALPSDFHDQGWDSSVVYDVQIDYTPTSTTIEISDGGTPVATLVINDGSYPSGRAGPYNRSQPDSCAANWTSSCLP